MSNVERFKKAAERLAPTAHTAAKAIAAFLAAYQENFALTLDKRFEERIEEFKAGKIHRTSDVFILLANLGAATQQLSENVLNVSMVVELRGESAENSPDISSIF